MQDALAELLRRRKQRAIAIILGVKEREIDNVLSQQQSQKLRKVVLDQLNEFYEFVVDLMSSLDNGEVVLNEEYLAKLDDIHTTVLRLPLQPMVSASKDGTG